MNIRSRPPRLPFFFAAFLAAIVFMTARSAQADVRVQFVPSSGTAPLQGGSWYSVGFPGTTAAVSGTLSGVDTTVASNGTLSVNVTGGTSSGANTQAQLTRTRNAVTVSGSGGFTEGPLYQSFGGFNVTGGASMWLTLSGMQPSTWFLVELYAYDNSYNGSMTFTDMTTGSAATSGSIAYTAGATFTTNSDADGRFSLLMAVQSDTTGRISIKGSGINNGNPYAIVNGLRISSKWIPKVYVPTLNSTERVVAAVTPQQFGAKGDGVTDDTAAFQNAINFVYHAGIRAGGVLYVPAAMYAFYGNLSVPEGVTLHGDWKNWTTGTSGAVGTTFAIYTTGSTATPAFIDVSYGCNALIGINFWYPNQNPSSIVPYPFTVNLASTGTNGVGFGGNTVLENVVFINSYQGACLNGNEYSLRGVYGSPLATGIQVDGGADWASMADIDFSPAIWSASNLPNAPGSNGPHATWMRNNGSGMVLMRIDGINCVQVNISGYNIGVNMAQNVTGATPMPSFYSGTIQNCNTGILANAMPGQQGLQLTNFTVSAGTAISHTALNGFYIHLENCVVTGTGGTAVLLNGINDWLYWFQAQDCTINGTIIQNEGLMDIVNCTLNSGTQCIVGSSACKTAFAGCTFLPSQNIVNNGTSTRLLISSSGATLASSPVINPGIAWSSIFTAYQACQPAKQDLFVATDYGAAGDGSTDDTAAIQAALAAAAGNGGGIVYLPGGHYKTSASLTVATGVELRGVYEVRHATGPWRDATLPGQHPANGHCKASVIQPTAGAGGTGGPPAVILSATSGIRGVDFSYESQNPATFTTGTPVAYPPSIQGRGANVHAIGCDLPNTYIGIDFDTYSCPNHYCSMIYGVTLNTLIKVGNGSSGYIVDTEAQTSYWDQLDDTASTLNYSSGTYISTLEVCTLANATVHQWGDCSETVAINPSINDNIAVHCITQNGRGPMVVGVVQTDDVSNYGFYLEGSGTSNISLANSWIVTGTGAPFFAASSYQGLFRLFNLAMCGENNPTDYSIAGGDVGIQLAHIQLYGPQGAQVTGGVFHLINQCTYITYQTTDRFPTYPINFSGTGVSGNPSQAVGNFAYNGFAVTAYPGSVENAWQNFSRYATPSFPEIPQTGLVATGSVGGAFSYLIPASNNPTSYNATGLPSSLSVNMVTGMIGGTPSVACTNSVVLSATNASGSGTAGLTLRILPQPPSITSTLNVTGTQSNGFSYQIAATNAPTAFSATGLPSGLTVNTTTGIISGVPAAAGTSSVLLSASNDGGASLSATLTLAVLSAPLSVTSALSASGTDRSAFSYLITADHSPIGYGAANLPPGLGVNIGTGSISGTPTATGTFSVTISAFNISGTGSALLTLTVSPAAPLITSTLNVTGTNGAAFNYQISASDNPTSYGASGLPSGLSVNTSSGLISGTPALTATSTAIVSATNTVGSGSAGLSIGILPSPPSIPSGFTGVSGSGQVALSWTASAGAVSYNVKRSLTSGAGYANLTNVTGTSTVDTAVTNGTLYYYVVTSLGSSGVESANSKSLGVMPGALPSPWQWQDFATSNIGGANYSGTTFTLAACGGDIYGASDTFGYIYQAGGTACEITARVVSVANTNGFAKAGVMMRNTLTANSAFVDAVEEPNASVQNQSRATAGQSSINSLTTGGVSAPYWVKAVRSGTAFTTYISSNGVNWSLQATVAVNMASGAYLGLPVASNNSAAICISTFDNVTVSGTLPPAPQIGNYQSPVVVRIGDNMSYQIAASNSPTYYGATGLPAGLTFTSSSGSIKGSPIAVGTSVISITAGNDGGVDTEALTIAVVPQAPVITSALTATGTSGSAFSYQITASNSPSSYAATGLPQGLGVDPGSGLITGTPIAGGTSFVTISASNDGGTTSGTLTLSIGNGPPWITSASNATGCVGRSFTFQVVATNSPTGYGATGLPGGLGINSGNGLISGTPAAAGSFSATVSATNALGSGSAILSIAVQMPIDAWKTTMFGANATNSAVSGDLVVNNCAGVSNLMAYALGANPFATLGAELPASALKPPTGTRYLSLEFPRNTAATDISYIVETGSNPGITGGWSAVSTFANGSWLPSANVTESGSGAQVSVVVSDTISAASIQSRFMRLKVIH